MNNRAENTMASRLEPFAAEVASRKRARFDAEEAPRSGKQQRRVLDFVEVPPASFPSSQFVAEVASRKRTRFDAEVAPRSGKQKRTVLNFVEVPPASFPRSQFAGYEFKLPATSESNAIQLLRKEWEHQRASGATSNDEESQWLTFDLSDFTIYRPKRDWQNKGFDHSLEMESLHFLKSKVHIDELLFDGMLSCAGVVVYVKQVPFSILAIEGYGDLDLASVRGNISIQSDLAEASDDRIWYRLETPSNWYERYHEPFIWIADLAKHFMDFITHQDKPELRDFQARFHIWLLKIHRRNADFLSWLSDAPSTDFRTAIVANYEYLWKEYYSLAEQSDDFPSINQLPIWSEIVPEQLGAIKRQPATRKKTVVTPYVNECFKDTFFGAALLSQEPVPPIAQKQRERMASLNFSSIPAIFSSLAEDLKIAQRRSSKGDLNIKIGDVVGVARDSVTFWKDSASLWFAYVQGLRQAPGGDDLLDVIWLYRPSDTTLSNMHYPIKNELFFSDNCNCGDGAFRAADIACKMSIEWFAKDVSKAKHVIVRQKYDTLNHSFVTLKGADFTCHHKSKTIKSEFERLQHDHRIGDTVYVQGVGLTSDVLEPSVIVKFDIDAEKVILRKLPRRHRDLGDSAVAKNELVWTAVKVPVSPQRVAGRCYVRFFLNGDVPSPYDRGGSGHFWFITHRLMDDGKVQAFARDNFPRSLNQAFDPASDQIKNPLRGLDLFCGGGNFGRGIEDGGAVEMKFAVEIDGLPLHTYRANLKDPDSTALFLGSVDDFLAAALSGEDSKFIAKIGDIQFLCAGSPCRAFSLAQRFRLSDKSIKNASLVASVAAFIDLYRPAYALLENVSTMANSFKVYDGQNVFSQLLCCLVGMGYQVSQFNIDAYSCGAPQSRSRLFVAIAAPGVPPIEHPQLSNAHPPGTPNRSLGSAANGQTIGDRKFGPTPFDFVTADEAFGDLPNIYDGRVGSCISNPDHRSPRGNNGMTRAMTKMIPTLPVASSLATAAATGWMAAPQVEEMQGQTSEHRKSAKSNAWRRIDGSGLIPAITRKICPGDGFTGQVLHPRQHRNMTVLEARRAQGYPDNEVLIGRPSDQWSHVGDAVSRHVAFALGMCVREAWLSGRNEDRSKGTESESSSIPAQQEPTKSSKSQKSTPANRNGPQGVISDFLEQNNHSRDGVPEGNPTQTLVTRQWSTVRTSSTTKETTSILEFSATRTEEGTAEVRPKRARIWGKLHIANTEGL